MWSPSNLKLFQTLWGTFWLLFSSLTIVGAVVLVLLRLTLPVANHFTPQVEEWISTESGVPVTLGDLSITLEGRFLTLRVEQVSVSTPEGEPHIAFEAGEVQFDLMRSLQQGMPYTTRFLLERPVLAVVHREDGRFQMAGAMGADQEGSAPPALVAWLLGQPRLEVREGVLQIETQQRSLLQWGFTGINLQLINSGYRHQATGTVQLAGEQANPVEVQLEWFGDLLNPQGWDGQLYLKGVEQPMMALSGGSGNPLAPILQGEADLEFWGEWLSGQLEKGRGTLQRDPRYLDLPGLASGSFYWKKQGREAWQLQVDQLVWGGEEKTERSSHPSSAKVVRKQSPQGREMLLGAIDYIRLVSSPELSGLHATVAHGDSGVMVTGGIHQLQFRSFPKEASLFNEVEAKMVLDQISIAGTRKMAGYGVAGVNGVLHLNEQQGYWLPQPGQLQLGLGALYPDYQPLELKKGLFHWQQQKSSVVVTLDQLSGQWKGVELEGATQLLLPQGKQAPLIDLALVFDAQRVTDVVSQLPRAALDPELMAWLQQSLQSGRLQRGEMRLQGPLDQRFPYEKGEGHFSVAMALENLYLQYDPEWPSISHSHALLRFDQSEMSVVLNGGKLDGNLIHRVEAKGKTVGNHPLQVQGRLVSSSERLMRSLEQTPLRGTAQQLNAVLDLRGYALLDLDLKIPLDEQPTTVKGRVELHDNLLTVRDIDLPLKQLRGNIEFTEAGLSIDGMKGELLGGPVELSAFTAQEGEQQQVVVNLGGEMQGGHLKSWLALPVMQQKLFWSDGKTPWDGRLTINEEKLQLHLHSKLAGIALQAPAPLNKQSSDHWPTTLTLEMAQGLVSKLRVSTPERLLAQLGQDQGKEEAPPRWRGEIRLGALDSGIAAMPLRAGVTLQGGFEEINLDRWYALWKEQLGKEEQSRLARFNVDQILVSADQAALFNQQLKNLSLVMKQGEDGHWGIGVSSEQIEGTIQVPATEEETLVVDLQHLQLYRDDELATSGALEEIDPAQFPPMRVTSRQTEMNGINFGLLQLETVPIAGGLKVERAMLQSEAMRAVINGRWLQRGGRPLSQFTMQVEGERLGGILGLFGYRGEIDRGKSVISIEAGWADSPLAFSLDKLQGTLGVSVAQGQLLDVEQGVGRVFGLLGIHTLVRRLTLDFSDLTDKGFAFDTIAGDFELKEGNAHTRNLVIDGPSAMIKVDGRTGLVAQDYDQVVTVSPKISETLPATGALVGGPAGAAVGSVLLLYQKLFQEEGLAATRYQLSGGWEDPQLEEILPNVPVHEPDASIN